MNFSSPTFWIVAGIVLTALVFDYLNGFHDAANSIATVVSTRVLTPGKAVLWAAFFNFTAAFGFGVGVAKTIGSGMQFPSSLAYAYLACGRIAAAALFSSKSAPEAYGSVHSAAGCLLALEAGAIVTELNGAPWTLATRSTLIAASKGLHETLSQLLAEQQR